MNKTVRKAMRKFSHDRCRCIEVSCLANPSSLGSIILAINMVALSNKMLLPSAHIILLVRVHISKT